jgi:hypothetical protein
MLKIILQILISGLLWCNTGYAKIINIEDRFSLKVPNNYEYLEIETIPDSFSLAADLIGQDPKIFLIGTKKSINFAQQAYDYGEDVYDPIVEKIEQKNFKSEKQYIKFVGTEMKKFFKKNGYEGIVGLIFSNETIDQLDNDLLDFIEDIRGMNNAELKKEVKKYKKEINNWLYNEIGEELKPWVKIRNFKVAKNKYNDPFVVLTIDYKVPPLKGQSEVYMFIKDNKIILAYFECLNCSVKKGSIEKMFKPTFSANEIKKTSASKSDLSKQIKTLNELYKQGALTKEEFEKAKKKLLN